MSIATDPKSTCHVAGCTNSMHSSLNWTYCWTHMMEYYVSSGSPVLAVVAAEALAQYHRAEAAHRALKAVLETRGDKI